MTSLLDVEFDRRLRPGALDFNNWSLRANNTRRLGEFPCTAAGFHVTCFIGGGILQAGPDIVDYLPPPFDVDSLSDDAPAEAFADFPLQVVP